MALIKGFYNYFYVQRRLKMDQTTISDIGVKRKIRNTSDIGRPGFDLKCYRL